MYCVARKWWRGGGIASSADVTSAPRNPNNTTVPGAERGAVERWSGPVFGTAIDIGGLWAVGSEPSY